MRYGEIARRIRQEAAELTRLAEELERIEQATPKINSTVEVSKERILLSVKEASEALGISRATIYALMRRDDFPVIRIGSRTMINAKKLQAWIDNQSEIDIQR